MIKDPTAPEKMQPEIIGYQGNLRVSRLGDQPCIVADHYVKPDHWDEYHAFPYRSVDYYHKNREITGVACLRRDPELDLGLVGYSREPETECSSGTFAFYATGNRGDDGGCLLYQRDVHMPDTVPMPEKEEKKPPLPPAEGEQAGQDQEYQKWCGHMANYSKSDPTMSFVHSQVQKHPEYEQYAAGMGGGMGAAPPPAAGGAGSPGPTSVAPPAELGEEKPKEGEDMESMQRLQEIERELVAERRAASEEAIQYLRDAGYTVEADDVDELAVLTPKERQAKIDKLKRTRARKEDATPTARSGAPTQLQRAPFLGSRKPTEARGRELDRDQVNAITAYAANNKIRDFDEAKKAYQASL